MTKKGSSKPSRKTAVSPEMEEVSEEHSEPAAEGEAEAPDMPEYEPPADSGEEAVSSTDALLAEREELNDKLLRLRAEFDNYRKRISRENERLRKKAAAGLIGDLLPVLDNLERALQFEDDASGSLSNGVQMVHKQMCELLEQNGLKPIPVVDEEFDPRFHEAIAQVESEDVPKGRIAEEFQRGYMIGDDVLRPSKVTVSRGPVESHAEGQPETEMEVE